MIALLPRGFCLSSWSGAGRNFRVLCLGWVGNASLKTLQIAGTLPGLLGQPEMCHLEMPILSDSWPWDEGRGPSNAVLNLKEI